MYSGKCFAKPGRREKYLYGGKAKMGDNDPVGLCKFNSLDWGDPVEDIKAILVKE